MKRNKTPLALLILALLMVMLVSCSPKEAAPPDTAMNTASQKLVQKDQGPAQLPVRFQSPAYYTLDEQASDLLGEDTEDYEIKVGANITSTQGPQPLWDILKRLVSLKGMNVGWASDVNQNALVDVDINATDNFFDAIDNMLRQVDYYHEVEGNTIIVKFKETRTYHLPLPKTKVEPWQ